MKKILLTTLLLLVIGTNLNASTWEEDCDNGKDLNYCNMGGYNYLFEYKYKKALALFNIACEHNFSQSCAYLGGMYSKGQGVEKNNQKAMEYSKKACDLDKGVGSGGCLKLALLLENKKDYKSAAKYYEIATNSKIQLSAYFNLGVYYYLGKGVKKDKIKAYKYWYHAAKNGNTGAQDNLDILCKESPWACK